MDETMERAIRELCAFLPQCNGREVWSEFNVREYLSVTSWRVVRSEQEAGDGFADFWIESTLGSMPGEFQVRIDLTTGRRLGVYWSAQSLTDPELIKTAATLLDLTFTPFMVDRLRKQQQSHIDHPDAGSW
jgi:hypothetical protein